MIRNALIGIIIALLVVLGIGAFFTWGYKQEAERVPELEAALIQSNTQIKQMIRDAKANERVTNDHQKELEELRVLANKPARVVRLCPVSSAAPASSDTTPRPGSDATPSGAREFQEEAERDPGQGPDIGADLEAEADRADKFIAGYRAAQNYISSVCLRTSDTSSELPGSQP